MLFVSKTASFFVLNCHLAGHPLKTFSGGLVRLRGQNSPNPGVAAPRRTLPVRSLLEEAAPQASWRGRFRGEAWSSVGRRPWGSPAPSASLRCRHQVPTAPQPPPRLPQAHPQASSFSAHPTVRTNNGGGPGQGFCCPTGSYLTLVLIRLLMQSVSAAAHGCRPRHLGQKLSLFLEAEVTVAGMGTSDGAWVPEGMPRRTQRATTTLDPLPPAGERPQEIHSNPTQGSQSSRRLLACPPTLAGAGSDLGSQGHCYPQPTHGVQRPRVCDLTHSAEMQVHTRKQAGKCWAFSETPWGKEQASLGTGIPHRREALRLEPPGSWMCWVLGSQRRGPCWAK